MGLKILHGEHPEDLVESCLEEICSQAVLWPQKRAFLVVPEQTKADMERRYLEVLKRLGHETDLSQSLMMVDVVSFQRLAHRLLSEVGGVTQNYLDDVTRTMLIYRILSENKSSFKILSVLSDRMGFVPELESVLGDFLRYHITPDKIHAMDTQDVDPSFSAKMQDFALLLERLEEVTNELGYCDQRQELSHLSDLLETVIRQKDHFEWPLDRLKYLQHTTIWIMGFGQNRDFTPQEWAVVQKLHSLCERITITVCADTIPLKKEQISIGDPAFYFGRQTAFHLGEQFPGSNILEADLKIAKAPSLTHLTAAFAKRSPSIYEGNASVIHINLPQSSMDELSFVAGEIRRLVLTEGYRYKDISVVLCDPQGYESNLKAVFGEYGLDPFLDKRRPLSGTVLMRFILSLLDLSVSGWSFKSLMTCLKSGLCHIVKEDVDLFENYCLKHGLFKGYRIFDVKNYSPDKDADGPAMMELVNRVLLPIKSFHGTFKTAATCSAKAKVLLSFMASYGDTGSSDQVLSGIAKQVDDLSAEWLAAKDQEAALALVSSFNELCRLLSNLTGSIGDTIMSPINFRKVLHSGMEAAFSGAIPSYVDQIQISDVKRGYQKSCKILFLVGASREEFPFTSVKEGFLRGYERELLAKALQVPFPSRAKDQVHADYFTAYALLDCPKERLYMSCPQSKEASSVIDLARRIIPAVTVLKNKALAWHDPRLFSKSALQRYVRSRLLDEMTVDSSIDPTSLLMEFPQLGQSWGQWSTVMDVKLSPDQMQRQQTKPIKMSVSQLESYAACPFAYFSNYILTLKEREQYKVEANDVGSFLHRIFEVSLRSYNEEIAAAGSLAEKEAIYQTYLHRDFKKWSEELFNLTAGESDTPLSRDPAFLAGFGSRIIRLSTHSLKALFQDISPKGFQPDKLEWQFGKSGIQPLTIHLSPDQTVELRGVIDRIDLDHELQTYRIIDYKSGDKKIDYNALFQGLSVQLPSYLLAYGATYPHAVPASAGYFYLTTPMISLGDLSGRPSDDFMTKAISKKYALRNLAMPAEDLQLIGRHSLQKMRSQCQDLLDGNFAVAPRQMGNNVQSVACTYCAYSAVCGMDPHAPPCVKLKPLPVVKTSDNKKMPKKDVFLKVIKESIYPNIDQEGENQ